MRSLLIVIAAVLLVQPSTAMPQVDPRTDGNRPLLHVQMQTPAGSTVKVGPITIEAPWFRATPKGAKVAGGYMRITNSGPEPDRLLGGTLDVANRVEIHEMAMEGAVMRMRPLTGGLEIRPGETIALAPGGYHVMGLDLRGGLVEGQVVQGTLQFQKAGIVKVEYVVRPIGAGPMH